MKQGKHFKRLWSLMLLLIAMLMPQGGWAISGSGTSSSPYLIANEADLRTFQQYVEDGNSGIYGKLTADITLTSAWTRIGRADRKFTGYFDGQGHTISGMNLSFTAYEHGFFGFVNNATIKNFTLTGTMTSSANGNHSHGTVVGSAAGTTVIENVTSSVNLTLNHTGFTNIGGIVGHMDESSKVIGCTYTGTINLNKDSEQVGGIVGYAQRNLYITDNVFSGTITSTGTCKYLAGIAGKTDGTIEVCGCTNIGTINGGPSYDCVAGIVGYVQYQSRALITNCYFGGSLSSTSSGTSLGMGGILGAVNDDAGTNFRGLTYCFSDGTLTATNSSSTQIGGIAGVIKSKAVSKVLNNSYLSGTASRLAAISNSSSSFDSSNKAITISVTAGTGGTVQKSYVYPTSTTATQLNVEATPNSGYHYVNWSDNGAQTHNVSLTGNVSLTATFGAHNYGNWITDDDASCTKTGTKHRVCATCGAREDGTIAALNHDYQQVVDANYFVSAATCGDGAKYHKKCSRCSTKEGPIWENLESRPAHTFAASDTNHDVCTVCNHGFFHYTASKKVDPTFPNALMDKDNQTLTIKTHTFSNGQGVIEFDKPLVKIGTQAFSARSGYTFTGSLVIPNTVTIIYNAAFSGQPFNGALIIPSSVTHIYPNVFYHCDKLTSVQMASVPQIDSSNAFYYVTSNIHVVLNENSYVYKGSNEFPSVKSVTAPCNLDLTGSAVASHANLTLTHNYSNVVDANYLADRATCTTDATYFKKCSRCTTKGEKWTATGTALDHDYSQVVDANYLVYPATCDADAVYHEKCSRCTTHGAEWSATGTAIGHDYSQVVDANYLVSAATCGSDAIYHEKCSRCTTHGAEWSATGTATGNHSYTNNTLTASPIEDGLYAYACDNGCGTHNDDHIIKDFNGAGNHLELTKDGEGNYSTSEDITLADANGFVSPVDFSAPSVTYNRNIVMDDGMYSFIVPFDIPADQAAQLGTFYQYRTHGEGKVYFDNADGIVRANTAYFFKPAKNITSITVDDAEIKATTSMPNAENPSAPGLYGTYSQIDIPVGAYGYGNMGFFIKAGTDNLLRPFRAYLWLGSGASMAKALAFFGDYDVDAIEFIGADDLDLNAPIYNLQGQRIVTPKKGEIYIQNGKKVMKK